MPGNPGMVCRGKASGSTCMAAKIAPSSSRSDCQHQYPVATGAFVIIAALVIRMSSGARLSKKASALRAFSVFAARSSDRNLSFKADMP